MITKRLTCAATAALAVVLAGCSGPPHDATSASGSGNLAGSTITFAGFGGALQDNQAKAWESPFTAKTGVQFANGTAASLQQIQAQVQAKNVQFDVTEDFSTTFSANCGTTFAKLDNVDKSAIDPKYLTNDCGIPVVKFATVLLYNSTKFAGNEPTSVSDFFDVAKFPGKRSTLGVPQPIVDAAAASAGVAPAQLYPLNLDTAFAQLDKIKSSLSIQSSAALIVGQMLSGDADMAFLPNGRAWEAAKQDPDLKVVFAGAPVNWDNLGIPIGSKNQAAAEAWLSYVATPTAQDALAHLYPYGVTTSSGTPQLDALQMQFFPDAPANKAETFDVDQSYWQKNNAAVNARWASWTTS